MMVVELMQDMYDYMNGMVVSWVQLGLDIDGEAAGDQSGTSVSLSSDGNRLAIGARYNDDSGVKCWSCSII